MTENDQRMSEGHVATWQGALLEEGSVEIGHAECIESFSSRADGHTCWRICGRTVKNCGGAGRRATHAP